MHTKRLTMRQQMAHTLTDVLDVDRRLVVLLGNISVSLFEKRLLSARPPRVYDVGISEQAMVSMAAGLALECPARTLSGELAIDIDNDFSIV